jgi:carboxynorspermidine decarboxylase
MPYRADIIGAGEPNALPHTYRLGGLTCLAGDVMGDYSFAEPLQIGQRLMFGDMSHYTMVKTSTFNGTRLPALVLWDSETDELEVVREFDYHDFKHRLS